MATYFELPDLLRYATRFDEDILSMKTGFYLVKKYPVPFLPIPSQTDASVTDMNKVKQHYLSRSLTTCHRAAWLVVALLT